MLSFALLAMLASIKFCSFYCKTCTSVQNTQTDCYQWLSRSFECTKFVFGGDSPRTSLEELTALPQTGWFKGALLLREGRGRKDKEGAKERERRGREGRGREGRGERGTGKAYAPPLTQIPGSASVTAIGVIK